ncbi:MAG: hypothetical protein EXS55_02760 [Candidatus Magasanikbacteria bacterium]|nr:hypothetical protein [Candidatus Magasanikbacteria bacterium]
MRLPFLGPEGPGAAVHEYRLVDVAKSDECQRHVEQKLGNSVHTSSSFHYQHSEECKKSKADEIKNSKLPCKVLLFCLK